MQQQQRYTLSATSCKETIDSEQANSGALALSPLLNARRAQHKNNLGSGPRCCDSSIGVNKAPLVISLSALLNFTNAQFTGREMMTRRAQHVVRIEQIRSGGAHSVFRL